MQETETEGWRHDEGNNQEQATAGSKEKFYCLVFHERQLPTVTMCSPRYPTSRPSTAPPKPSSFSSSSRPHISPVHVRDAEERHADVIAWFRSRWQRMAESIKVERQLAHHRQRQEDLIQERAKLIHEKMELQGEKTRRDGDQQGKENEGDQQRRLEEVEEQLENMEEELRYQQGEITRLQQPRESVSSPVSRQGQRTTSNNNQQQHENEEQRERMLESFLAELGSLPSASTRALLHETCRLLLDQRHLSDQEATQLSVLQLRLDQKTAVCSNYAKALQRTKVEFSRRLVRAQKESEDKIQYLLKQLREYEHLAPLLSSSATGALTPRGDQQQQTQESPTWRRQLLEEQKKSQEIEALNLSLLKEVQMLQKLLAATTSGPNTLPSSKATPSLVRISSKALREVPNPHHNHVKTAVWNRALRDEEVEATCSRHDTTTSRHE